MGKPNFFKGFPLHLSSKIFEFLPDDQACLFLASHRNAFALKKNIDERIKQKVDFFLSRAPSRLYDNIKQVLYGRDPKNGIEPLAVKAYYPAILIHATRPFFNYQDEALYPDYKEIVITSLSLAIAKKHRHLVDQFITQLLNSMNNTLRLPHNALYGNTLELITESAFYFDNDQLRHRAVWLHSLNTLAHYGLLEKLIELYTYYETAPKNENSYTEIVIIDVLRYLLHCAASKGEINTIEDYLNKLITKLEELTYFANTGIKLQAATKRVVVQQLTSGMKKQIVSEAIRNDKEAVFNFYLPELAACFRENDNFYSTILSDLFEEAATSHYTKYLDRINREMESKNDPFIFLFSEMEDSFINALSAAASTGSTNILAWLFNLILHEELEINLELLQNPIYIAAFCGHTAFVDYLMNFLSEHDSTPETIQIIKQTLLFYAAIGGQNRLIAHCFGQTEPLSFNTQINAEIAENDSSLSQVLAEVNNTELLAILYNGHWNTLSYLFQRISNPEELFYELHKLLLIQLIKCHTAPDPIFARSRPYIHTMKEEDIIEQDWLVESLEKLYGLAPIIPRIDWEIIKSQLSTVIMRGLGTLEEEIRLRLISKLQGYYSKIDQTSTTPQVLRL